MLKKALQHKQLRQGLLQQSRRYYERMSTEEYLINTRKAQTNINIQRAKLKPMLEASKANVNLTLLDHGSDTNIQLFGMP